MSCSDKYEYTRDGVGNADSPSKWLLDVRCDRMTGTVVRSCGVGESGMLNLSLPSMATHDCAIMHLDATTPPVGWSLVCSCHMDLRLRVSPDQSAGLEHVLDGRGDDLPVLDLLAHAADWATVRLLTRWLTNEPLDATSNVGTSPHGLNVMFLLARLLLALRCATGTHLMLVCRSRSLDPDQ